MIMRRISSSHPGLSLVELLLFVGLLALMGGAIVGFFILTSESRIRQQTTTDVEQNIIQLHQFLAYEIRHAERIIDPPLGRSGSVLALQTTGIAANPTIITVQSGYVLLVRGESEYLISPPEVTVTDFRVFNTSPTASRASLGFTFTVSRLIPIPSRPTYSRKHEGAVTVLPDDALIGNTCGCAVPRCDGGKYEWEICESGSCRALSGALLCSK